VYTLDRPGNFSVQIFSTAGRYVATVWKGYCAAGKYSLTWKARDNQGISLPGGSYLIACRLNEKEFAAKRMFLTR
jgi:hypothetical protein